MNKQLLSGTLIAICIGLLSTFSLNAQEGKKEVHLKIVEDGKVTKDTTYTFTGSSEEFEHFAEMPDHQFRHKEVRVRHEGGPEHENGHNRETKEVKVIVHSDRDEIGDVEEIWIHKEGPCHTTIIHEGACPGDHQGEVDVKTEEKVIKTKDGKKVVTTTVTDTRSPNPPKSKK